MRAWISRLLFGKEGKPGASAKSQPKPSATAQWKGPKAPAEDPTQAMRKLLKSAAKDMLEGGEDDLGEQSAVRHEEDVPHHVRALVAADLKEMGKFGAAFERFRALNDPNSSLADIAKTVGTDPVFSARVLAVANSPYFFALEPVNSVHHAVLVLGMVNLKTLYFREYFRMLGAGDGRVKHVRKEIWTHLALTAVCAFHVAEAVRTVEPVTAYTLGLLHDVGKFPMLNLPMGLAESRELYDLLRMPGEPCREDAMAGINHVLVGRMACESWRFPDLITQAIAGHHCIDELDEEDEVAPYVACLRLANQLARIVGADDPDEVPFAPLPGVFHPYVDKARLLRIVSGDAFFADMTKTGALFSSDEGRTPD